MECRGEERRAAVRGSHTRLMCFVASSRCVAWTHAQSGQLTLGERADEREREREREREKERERDTGLIYIA